MEERYGREGRIWAVDRGMIDAANLEWLKERGSRYIVGTPKGELKRFEQELLKGTWHEIREGLEVRIVPEESGSETFILCRSATARRRNGRCASGSSGASKRVWRRLCEDANRSGATWE